MPPVMFSVVTKYHKGRHSLFLYNSEIFYAFTQDILRSQIFIIVSSQYALLGKKIIQIVLNNIKKSSHKFELFIYLISNFTIS